ncbi:MAG: hypothetical protein HFE92_03690 [Acutalibacter muris]|nr:hypothetical protein [Acutalibacter muris]
MNPDIECTTTEGTVIPIRDYQPQNDKNVFQAMAVEKIAAELKSFTGGQKEKCVSTHVAAEITHFCEESPEFAEVVYKTKRTLSDCCAEVLNGTGNYMSDNDVYRGIVKAYFPNADVRFLMNIEINGAAPSEEEMARVPEKPKPSQPKPAPKAAPKPAEKAAAPAAPKPAEPEINLAAGQRFIQLSLF